MTEDALVIVQFAFNHLGITSGDFKDTMDRSRAVEQRVPLILRRVRQGLFVFCHATKKMQDLIL